jgi:hypothetical protein
MFELLQTCICVLIHGADIQNIKLQPEESEWDDEFGNDLYVSDSVPSQLGSQAVDASENKVDEDSKIKALIDTSALDYSQIPDGYGGGRGYGRGMGGRMMGGRGFGNLFTLSIAFFFFFFFCVQVYKWQ